MGTYRKGNTKKMKIIGNYNHNNFDIEKQKTFINKESIELKYD